MGFPVVLPLIAVALWTIVAAATLAYFKRLWDRRAFVEFFQKGG